MAGIYREESYTINVLEEFANFDNMDWKLFVYDRIRSLEEASKQLDKERIEVNKLRANVEQLKTYIDVLERQLLLASKVISAMNAEFPVYTEKKEADA